MSLAAALVSCASEARQALDQHGGVMPDVMCMDLQDAQDAIQRYGVSYSRSEDATGQGRMQVIDSNWIVVAQSPRPGAAISEGDAVLSVVKDGERTCTASPDEPAVADAASSSVAPASPTTATPETAPAPEASNVVETSPASPVTPPASADPTASTVGDTAAPPMTPAPTAPPANALSTLDVLMYIPVQLEHRGVYDRELFAAGFDLDGDGCDTRAEVLIEESLSLAQVDPSGCGVVAGDWYSPYDALTFTSPGDVEVDHVVALKEAWDSGAWAWTPDQRIAFANDVSDPRTLVAVSAVSNGAKGDADPSNWLPADADVCRFVNDWIAIKARWAMSMDESEWGRLKNLLDGQCVGAVVGTWDAPPVVTPLPPPTPNTTTTSTTTTTTPPPPVVPLPVVSLPLPPPPPPPASSTDPRFGTCKEAKANGYGPYRVGIDSEYGWYRDADNDGIVCE